MEYSTKAEEFRDEFNKLESLIKVRFTKEYEEFERKKRINKSNKYHKPASGVKYVAENMKDFSKLKDELDYCCEVRNVLSHNPTINQVYIVEPSDEIIDLIKNVRYRIENPVRASGIMIKKSDIYYRNMHDRIWPALIEMNDKTYTHVPILDGDGVVKGVFSENTLLSWMISGESALIDRETRFEEIDEILPIRKHTAESFRFIPRDMPLLKINEIFEKALSQNDRIGLIFVTDDGAEKSPVLGIISAWDIASYK